MRPSFRILILYSTKDLAAQIEKYLQSKHFHIDTVEYSKSELQKISETAYNLIICEEKLNNNSGFRVFKKLEDELKKRNTAFFLVLNEFLQEDIQLGLELGIDNFIFTPIDETSLRNKVEKLYKKSLQFNYYETPRFHKQFHTSPIPMFFSEDSVIEEGNDAFLQLLGDKEGKQTGFYFHELFDLVGNQKNHMNLRKLENGLIDQCWLEDVGVVSLNRRFNLYKSTIGSRDKNKLLTVIMPAGQYEKSESMAEEFPVFGACLKNDKLGLDQAGEIQLTPREYEIYKLSASGMPIKQIAAHLKISERTIEKHRSNIMKKTETHSIMEAIIKLQKQQFLFSKQ